MLVTIGICFKLYFDTRHFAFCNLSPSRMFLSLDLLPEYRIQHTIGLLFVTSIYWTIIFYRGVSGFATDCPCGVWCRGLTTCLLYVGPLFGYLLLNNSWAVGLTCWIVNSHYFFVEEEGNCSYLLPRAAATGSKGTNKGQIPKVPFDEFARCLVYRMGVTRSQFSANTGIPVCLVREIWQFKVLTGKEVTPLHEEGNSLQFRAGKKATHFCNKWFIDIWQTDKTESKERSQCEIVKWKYVSRCDEQTKTTCLIRPRGDVRNTIGTEWRRLKHL